MIPADIRIFNAKDLFVSQAALTGESEPVEKSEIADKKEGSLTETKNLAFMGGQRHKRKRAGFGYLGGKQYDARLHGKNAEHKTSQDNF